MRKIRKTKSKLRDNQGQHFAYNLLIIFFAYLCNYKFLMGL